MPNALVLQCGGPTPVVNASLAGVIAAWRERRSGGTLWGGRYALRALVSGDWEDLGGWTALDDLARTSGAALGGGRDRLDDADLAAGLGLLARRDVAAVFLIGGNGSIGAAHALATRATSARAGAPRVLLVPKTIDNDVPGTDFCPGYPSAARFLAASVRDLALDLASMYGFEDVALVETMGRHTGWLAAATAVARGPGTAPHAILIPEVPFAEARFLAAVREAHRRHGLCVVVAAEGVRDAAGTFLTEKEPTSPVEMDASGQKLFTRAGGPLPYVARLVRERAGLRCRVVRPDVIQRSSSALASDFDRAHAEATGRAAVAAAAVGETDAMVALERRGSEWHARTVPLAGLARERPLPPEFFDADALDVTAAFLDYARPLVGPLDAAGDPGPLRR